MGGQISPDFPMELIHKIIHEVFKSDRSALLQCCLVSKPFYLTARTHLWRDIVIGADSMGGQHAITRFTNICPELRTRYKDPHIPPLISLVRSVSITILSMSGYIVGRKFRPPTEEYHYALFNLHPLVDFINALDAIARSSAPGCGVHTVQIQGCTAGSRTNYFWPYVWKPIRDALTQLVTAPTVHTIRIKKVSDIPLGFFTHSPALQNLTLIRARIFTQTPSLDPLAISGRGSVTLDYLKIEDCTMHVAENPPVYRRKVGFEVVPPGTFVRLITDPVSIRSLDLFMFQDPFSLLESLVRAAPYCEELTLRSTIRETKDLPFHSLPTSLRHLALIPHTRLDFRSFERTRKPTPDAVCEVFFDHDDRETTISDALFLPTKFTAAAPATQTGNNLVLPRVTIHRPVQINLPNSQPPTSKFIPMGHVHDPLTSANSESFWVLFARSVYGIPAVDVEVCLPIHVFVDCQFEEGLDWEDVTKVEEEKICRDVRGVFKDVNMSMGLVGSLPKVRLHVSVAFNPLQ